MDQNTIEKETRYWELTEGRDWITVFLPNERKVYVRNYSLGYIFKQWGLDKYMSLCSISSLKLSSFSESLNETELRLMKEKIVFKYAMFLTYFIKNDNVQYDKNNDEFRITTDNEVISLSSDDIDLVFKNFKEIYCLGSVDDKESLFKNGEPVTEQGKKDLEIILKAKAAISAEKSGNITIDSIVMGVSVKHPSYNLFNIWDLKMWQLMETHKFLYNVDDIYFTKIGIYTGNIDTEKNKISPKELNWSSRKG